MKAFLCIAGLLLIQSLAAQEPQILRGRIISASSNTAIPNVRVSLSGPVSTSTISDSVGYYTLTLPPGNYSLTADHEGSRTFLIQTLVIHQGKQQVLDITLEELNISLESVSITAEISKEAVDIDMWDLQRYAAVFYDPARLVNSQAALINTDDQANNISIHGTSPTFLQWKLEGLEIVNPNHLENAGTLNDRPSLNGGGVNMLSAQLLKNSGFEEAPFSPQSGNVITGLFDMKLRNGNNVRYEKIVQASLLGTDLSIEGPFSKKHKSSFLVNYRYSTVGLLSLMGVSFGGEEINYQDLSYILTFPLKRSELKVFGVQGLSSTVFRGPTDTTLIKYQKDLLDIDYRSATSINGLSFSTSFSNSFSGKALFAFSMKEVSRFARVSANSTQQLPDEEDSFQQKKFSSLFFVAKRFSNWMRLKAGTYVNYFKTELSSKVEDSHLSAGKISEPLLQPFISLEGRLGKKIDFRLGLHSLYQIRIQYIDFQPRLLLNYSFSDRQKLTFNYGLTSQLQATQFYLATESNNSLQPLNSHCLSLKHQVQIRAISVHTGVFFQSFGNIATSVEKGFSGANYFNEHIDFNLTSDGSSQVYGVDASLERELRGFYGLLSGSLFKSTYAMKDHELETRFNTGYNIALTLGKEFILKSKNKFISIDVRSMQRQGFRIPGVAFKDEQYSYADRLPDYFRTDLRFSFRKDKKRSSVIWALDIQNLSNAKNISNYYYDEFTQKFEPRYQLGLIPVLSYKVMW